MKLRSGHSLFFCLIILFSCQKDFEEQFLREFGDRSFNEFANKLIFFRSFDKNRNEIYFLHFLNSGCDAAYIVTIQANSGAIIHINDSSVRRTCHEARAVDISEIQQLFDSFLKLRINSIMVDEDSIITIHLYEASKFKLIKVTDENYENRLGEFTKMHDNWYKIDK